MSGGVTKSECFVTQLCERAFLGLWTHPNPIGKKGKELCDCLIVCSNHIVIISVKECQLKDADNPDSIYRWQKAAIEKSVKQIKGAERFIATQESIKRNDGRSISLPNPKEQTIHRVSVSLGGREEIPIEWGDFGSGFIHVLTESNVKVIFEELDTISDFIDFLITVEEFFDSSISGIFDGGGVQDLLAIYLLGDYSLELLHKPQSGGFLAIANDWWSNYENSSERRDRKIRLKDSYRWDKLIEWYANDLLTDGMFDAHSKQVTKNELALSEMALQRREFRANLVKSYIGLLENLDLGTRVAIADNQTAFVFMIAPGIDREARCGRLLARCLIIRNIAPNVITVVGIATDRPGTSKIGYSSDICYVHFTKAEWTKENQDKARQLQEESGYFKNCSFKNFSN